MSLSIVHSMISFPLLPKKPLSALAVGALCFSSVLEYWHWKIWLGKNMCMHQRICFSFKCWHLLQIFTYLQTKSFCKICLWCCFSSKIVTKGKILEIGIICTASWKLKKPYKWFYNQFLSLSTSKKGFIKSFLNC